MRVIREALRCPRCGQNRDPRFASCSCVEPNQDPLPPVTMPNVIEAGKSLMEAIAMATPGELRAAYRWFRDYEKDMGHGMKRRRTAVLIERLLKEEQR